jgi:uncharacterized protein (TIGR00730 family)
MTIGFFASSRDAMIPIYGSHVADVIQVLHSLMVTHIVYGGGTKGLMGVLYREAITYDMKVIGHNRYQWHEPELSNEVLYSSLLERQQGLLSSSSFFIALPGGIGTIYEITQVLCHQDVDGDDTILVIYNVDNWASTFITFIKELTDKGLITHLRFYITTTPEELSDCITRYYKK